MANFPEEQIYEYPPILKRKTFTKDVKYRIRIVRRLIDGIPRILFEIREYIVTEKHAMFTEKGFYFTLDELNNLENVIKDSKKYFRN
uniref:Uncharacterized protein n=1 Tax=viral metagenome TaxID=1070528 RepID=A0A6M3L7R2_9ZZZZ